MRIGKFKNIQVKKLREPSTGRPASDSYNKRIAYKIAWKKERAENVRKFVRANPQLKKFKICKQLPSMTHVKLAEQAKRVLNRKGA